MIRVALAQLNLVVGDVAENAEKIEAAIERGRAEGAQIVCTPELGITGYPPEDLVLKKSFVDASRAGAKAASKKVADVVGVVGFVDHDGDAIFNAAAVCTKNDVMAVYRKHLLPNYGVFDEQRYFTPGDRHYLFDTSAGVIGVCVCEDAWFDPGPLISQGDAGAQMVLNINASPFHKGKLAERTEMLCARARRARTSIVYVNMVGGQDELVFDGGSLAIDPAGNVIARLPQFEEAFAVVDVPLGEARPVGGPNVTRVALDLPEAGGQASAPMAEELGAEAEIYSALVTALRDYVSKNGFDKVVLGLSGGIDSTLVATIAVDALGPQRVLGLAMPSEFSSSHSVEDAKRLSANLGIEMLELSIADIYHSYLDTLSNAFGHADMGLAEENLQARARGNLVMAVSNRYGHLVLATGNKSEMACGYATLYGDMAGGFALLKDVFKTEVYALSKYRNSIGNVIPENVLTKPPSAELRPDQRDSDSLPPYDELDPILEAYIEHDAGIDDLVSAGHDRAVVEKVIALVDRAEYKRRQAPPGPKVTTKAFGRDRRLPITNRWREGQPGALPAKVTGQSSE
ncbi:MAG: NAD+ synthase [Actinomycetota bacterium]|nr:NAD+ synthase [Actinomycetota bacterium]